MKIMVIGSNSFSGANFIKSSLTIGDEIVAVSRSSEVDLSFRAYNSFKSRSNFEFHQLDLSKQSNAIAKLASSKKVNYVVNFAAQSMVAQSWENPDHWYQTNLVGLSTLINDFYKEKVQLEKFIQFSTPEVYGSTSGWQTESFVFNPTTPYAISRAASDFHLLAMNRVKGFPVVFTRASNVYGEGQQLYRIIPKTILSSMTGKQLLLDGGGNSVRSFIHIDDVSEALLKILKEGQIGHTYHISKEDHISIIDLVRTICKLLNVSEESAFKLTEDRPGKDAQYLLDSKKIRNELMWRDTIDLEEGLTGVIEWAGLNLSVLSKNSLEYTHRS
jgi:dTDP-glucose 4,6-dehydratase